jgi:hypothetical protein
MKPGQLAKVIGHIHNRGRLPCVRANERRGSEGVGTQQTPMDPGRVKTRNDASRRFRMFDRGQWRQYQPVSRSGFLIVQDARCRA